MAFGIYIHIPYCIQRCIYCDFATYEKSSILPPFEYVELIKKEIRAYGPILKDREVDTIYFGGGTPSLIDAPLIVDILQTLKEVGFRSNPLISTENTIEINPATIDEGKLQVYLQAGVNRFSVGAQSFKNKLLKSVGREHNADDTVKTIELLKKNSLNYTFDLLFALPEQTMEDLSADIKLVQEFAPNHISAYCLTVPDGHPLSKVRLPEEEQIEMFNFLEDNLSRLGMERYEISNFCKPGFESVHNTIYWTDQEYWGIGLSAHSYIKDDAWGKRFWNPSNINQYIKKISSLPVQQPSSIVDYRDKEHIEILEEKQSLTDFCHTFLRLKRGLSLVELNRKFGERRKNEVLGILTLLEAQGLVELSADRWRLSKKGVLISNHIFEKVTFLT